MRRDRAGEDTKSSADTPRQIHGRHCSWGAGARTEQGTPIYIYRRRHCFRGVGTATELRTKKHRTQTDKLAEAFLHGRLGQRPSYRHQTSGNTKTHQRRHCSWGAGTVTQSRRRQGKLPKALSAGDRDNDQAADTKAANTQRQTKGGVIRGGLKQGPNSGH